MIEKLPKLQVIKTTSHMQATALQHRYSGRTVGFVPTMGALHQGHQILIEEARLRSDIVVVSIFANPLQFNETADYEKYPKTLTADLEMCKKLGVDLVFAPETAEMYPVDFQTTIKAGALSKLLEGKSRPGHFEGMLTIVMKLFQIVHPHFAVFGEKDFQQLSLIQQMIRDFKLPIEIVPIEIIREKDGLALSSRNARLTKRQRKKATCLNKTLLQMQIEIDSGIRGTQTIIKKSRQILEKTTGFKVDYCTIVDSKTLKRVSSVNNPCRALIAGSFGSGEKEIRLIDNMALFPADFRSE